MATKLSSWVGQEGCLFERACLIFEGLGFAPPTVDIPDGTGAYVSNIVNQYQAYFTQAEILQIVDYARFNTLETLRRDAREGWIDREAVFGERSW